MKARILAKKRARVLRRSLTLPEVLLWQERRGSRLADLRIRRQHPIVLYVLDFYCSKQGLAIEVDGTAHGDASQADHDDRRDRWLSSQGIRVLRFIAADVLDPDRRQDVLATISVQSEGL